MNREINDTNQNGTRISGCRLLKRVLSILLCISLLFSSSIVTLAAGSAYTLNEAMSGTSIGTISYEGNSYPVYLFQFDAKQYSSLIISCTATSTYETERLRRLFTAFECTAECNAELLQSTVSAVLVTRQTVRLQLKNGQIIGKEDLG